MKTLSHFLLLACCAFAPVPASAQTASNVLPDPMAIVATFRTATGGAAWDGVNGLYRTDTRSGLTFLTWVDLRRPAMRGNSGTA